MYISIPRCTRASPLVMLSAYMARGHRLRECKAVWLVKGMACFVIGVGLLKPLSSEVHQLHSPDHPSIHSFIHVCISIYVCIYVCIYDMIYTYFATSRNVACLELNEVKCTLIPLWAS